MAYTQNTDDNGLVVAQAENVAGTAFTNLKANATNSLYVSVQEILATQEQATKGTNAHGAADTVDPPVKIGGHANAAEPAVVDENDMVNASLDLYGNAKVVGNIAADAADRGCPVKVGGIGNATANTLDEGDRGDLSMDLNSQVRVVADSVTKAADAAFPSAMIAVGARGNASAPAADDEGDVISFSVDLQGSQRAIGNLAHSAVDAGEPLKIGFYAADPAAMPADVTAADRVNGIADLKGRQIMTNDQVLGTAAAAIPANLWQVGGSDGTNARAIKTDSSGNVQVETLTTPYDATVGAAVPSAGAAIAISDGTNARLLKGDTGGVAFMQGEIAHDAADSGNPVKIGAKANAEEPAAVNAENDRANIGCDLKGNLRAVGNVLHGTADTGAPLKVGAKATAALGAAVDEGDRVHLSTDLYAQLRIMKQELSVTLHAAGAVGVPGANDTAVTGTGPYTHAEFLLNVTAAATDVDDTLDVFVDASPDGGISWVNVVHFTQVLGNGGAKKFVAAIHSAANLTDVNVTTDLVANAAPRSFLGNALRCRYAVVDPGAGVASFNFVLTAVLKQS